MTYIEIIAQTDRVHDKVHVALDPEYISRKQRVELIKVAIEEVGILDKLLGDEVFLDTMS